MFRARGCGFALSGDATGLNLDAYFNTNCDRTLVAVSARRAKAVLEPQSHASEIAPVVLTNRNLQPFRLEEPPQEPGLSWLRVGKAWSRPRK